MKNQLFFLSAVMTVASIAEPLTNEQLLQMRSKADQQVSAQEVKSPDGNDSALVDRPSDILSDSDILCFGNFATLVPKRAVIQVPENYTNRMVMKPGARFQSWKEFYAVNRGWITTVEVSLAVATGNEQIEESQKKQFTNSGNLVVATYHGGPISVRPPFAAPEKNK